MMSMVPDGPAHPAGQAHNVAAPVADGRDAVQGALQAGAVVGVEITDARDHQVDLGPRHFRIR